MYQLGSQRKSCQTQLTLQIKDHKLYDTPAVTNLRVVANDPSSLEANAVGDAKVVINRNNLPTSIKSTVDIYRIPIAWCAYTGLPCLSGATHPLSTVRCSRASWSQMKLSTGCLKDTWNRESLSEGMWDSTVDR